MFHRSMLPCTVFSRDPFVFAAFDTDFLNRASEFADVLRGTKDPVLLMQLGWQREKPEAARELAGLIRAAAAMISGLRVIVLTNSPVERANLTGCGIEAVYCHHNAFLDERRYPILPWVKKRFDAIYIAKLVPFKRHNLAQRVQSLLMIGNYPRGEETFAWKTLQDIPHACWIPRCRSLLISYPINQARCGLALSAEEGGMFACAEYLLCGIPVVNTRNLGGRDELIPGFAMRRAEDSPAAVARAVQELAREPYDLYRAMRIRFGILEKMYEHRAILLDLLESLGARKAALRFRKHFPHKLELRQGGLIRLRRTLCLRSLIH